MSRSYWRPVNCYVYQFTPPSAVQESSCCLVSSTAFDIATFSHMKYYFLFDFQVITVSWFFSTAVSSVVFVCYSSSSWLLNVKVSQGSSLRPFSLYWHWLFTGSHLVCCLEIPFVYWRLSQTFTSTPDYQPLNSDPDIKIPPQYVHMDA